MSITSSSDSRSLLALLPGAYFLQSRVKGAQDLLYLVATSFVPAWWMLVRLGGQGLVEAAANFTLGYLAFIAVYELGYLANDLFDARRPGGRKRWSGSSGAAFVAPFILIRLIVWGLVGWATGWIANPVWLGGTACLVLVFALHNLIQAAAPRSATFVQLGLLRFIMPVIGALEPARLPLALLIALLLYVYLRWLAYLDSKDLLRIAERRHPRFALVQMLLLGPIVGLTSLIGATSLPLEIWGFLMLLYASRQALERRRSAIPQA
ncbi:hypothetical protein GGQ97_002272 [Sphingomonas kaistensis]|uniref:Prenyltransferase n=1 Tax=Sphingomonas kaistensis TaxID=298708 RepID=A0A7X5Y770_9SPHN|nr:hypothetical protein [Sphingomonas kaistensis]NJC06479.1 hypothetical protein [Sphingomonas kaistensis]